MKNIISFKILVLFACTLCLMLSGCKKEEIPGPKGEPGTPGGGGNSNITSTSIFAVTSSQWKVDSAANCMKAIITFSNLTQEVVDKGGVKVYIQENGNWTDLPLVHGDLFTQFGFEVGKLHLSFINIEGGIPNAPSPANYRMVILAESGRPLKTNLNNKDVQQINNASPTIVKAN